MKTIKLRARLSAYTKGILPRKVSDLEQDIEYVVEAPKNEFAYVRQNGQWLQLDSVEFGDKVELAEKSGLNLTRDGKKAIISIRQETLIDSEIPKDYKYQDDTTYYIVETTPDLYINGGTAFSDSHIDNILEEAIPSEYTNILFGGNSDTRHTVVLQPLSSKGVLYNG